MPIFVLMTAVNLTLDLNQMDFVISVTKNVLLVYIKYKKTIASRKELSLGIKDYASIFLGDKLPFLELSTGLHCATGTMQTRT